MRTTRLMLTATALALLSACAAERKPPPPVVRPVPRPTPAPAPPPRPPADWRDVPITPGDWTYRAEATGSSARFGTPGAEPLLSLSCERAAGRLVLRRAGAAPGPVPLTIVTTSSTRSLSAVPEPAPATGLAVALAPRDPILDAMAFSRGRFMVEVPGLPPLYLPSWPEFARAIEDCR